MTLFFFCAVRTPGADAMTLMLAEYGIRIERLLSPPASRRWWWRRWCLIVDHFPSSTVSGQAAHLQRAVEDGDLFQRLIGRALSRAFRGRLPGEQQAAADANRQILAGVSGLISGRCSFGCWY